MNLGSKPAEVRHEEQEIVNRVKRALKRSGESSWEAADGFVKLSKLGWTQTRIGKECGASQSSVSRFVACAEKYAVPHNRPAFWDAYRHCHVGENSGVSEWFTPAPILAAARRVLGRIDCDPATAAHNPTGATRFFTADDDGLSKPWSGKLWLNPPYSKELIGQFVSKLVRHFRAGDVTAAITLTNNASETSWFDELAEVASVLCHLGERVKFLDEEGNPGSPLQGQSCHYLGPDPDAFQAAFRPLGRCWVPGGFRRG
jgi:ParB family chromosome partitioning protein